MRRIVGSLALAALAVGGCKPRHAGSGLKEAVSPEGGGFGLDSFDYYISSRSMKALSSRLQGQGDLSARASLGCDKANDWLVEPYTSALAPGLELPALPDKELLEAPDPNAPSKEPAFKVGPSILKRTGNYTYDHLQRIVFN